jgi:apolipoprotein D and lipocalin family protein
MKKILALIFACSLVGVAMANDNKKPLQTVPSVDLNRYIGTWYEIARYPNRFQRDCADSVTATYSFRDDGKIKVVNQCRKADGKIKSATGKAKIQDKKTNAKLKVSFFWIFYGNYWIIDLDENYQYAVIGEPNRDYLWILSRTKTMDDATYQKILERIKEQGYDVNKLVKTKQL